MVISLILVSLAAVCKAVMDAIAFRDVFKGDSFWDNKISWKNKYKDFDSGQTGARFWGSKTFLVFTTDGWHLIQFIMLSCFFLSIVLHVNMVNWWIDFIIYRVDFGVTFTIVFDYFFKPSK